MKIHQAILLICSMAVTGCAPEQLKHDEGDQLVFNQGLSAETRAKRVFEIYCRKEKCDEYNNYNLNTDSTPPNLLFNFEQKQIHNNSGDVINLFYCGILWNAELSCSGYEVPLLEKH
jgi:hypothetical protein